MFAFVIDVTSSFSLYLKFKSQFPVSLAFIWALAFIRADWKLTSCWQAKCGGLKVQTGKDSTRDWNLDWDIILPWCAHNRRTRFYYWSRTWPRLSGGGGERESEEKTSRRFIPIANIYLTSSSSGTLLPPATICIIFRVINLDSRDGFMWAAS